MDSAQSKLAVELFETLYAGKFLDLKRVFGVPLSLSQRPEVADFEHPVRSHYSESEAHRKEIDRHNLAISELVMVKGLSILVKDKVARLEDNNVFARKPLLDFIRRFTVILGFEQRLKLMAN